MPTVEDLGRLVKQKYAGAYDSIPDADLGRRVKAKYPDAYGQFEDSPAVQSGGSSTAPTPTTATVDPRAQVGSAVAEFVQRAPEALLQAAPAVLGTLGGVTGGVVGLPTAPATGGVGPVALGAAGAYAGGSLGRNIVSAVETARGKGPASGAEAARLANEEGKTQAALNAGGDLLGAGAKLGARGLMTMVAKEGGPEVARTMLENGIAATTKGFRRLEGRIGKAAQRTMNLVKWEKARGLQYDAVTMAKELYRDLAIDFSKMPISDPTRKSMVRFTRQFLKENGGTIDPERLHIMKQQADKIARQIHGAIQNKQAVPPGRELWAQWNKAFADRARIYLNETVGKVPGSLEKGAYEAANDVTESLIRVKTAIWPEVKKHRGAIAALGHAAANRATGATIGGAMGAAYSPDRAKGAMAGAAAGALLGTPGAVSKTALALDSPLLQLLLRKGPQAFYGLDQAGQGYAARDSLR